MRVEPDYFSRFRCIADACRHNCCIGWEIDIDADTLALYRACSGAFGSRLRRSIAETEGTASFRLGEGERCPFLNAQNLCDIILTLGDDALCDICRLHPRFFNTLGSREEAGLGLACEAAARLILSQTAPMRLLTVEAGAEDLSDWEASLLAARDRLLETAQDRCLSIRTREERLLALVGAGLPPRGSWRPLLTALERMDPAWDSSLARLDEPESEKPVPETVQEQLLCYFLYRHAAAASDPDDLAARTAFAVFGSRVVRALSRNTEVFYESARAYSAEVEYSEENTAALLNALRA